MTRREALTREAGSTLLADIPPQWLKDWWEAHRADKPKADAARSAREALASRLASSLCLSLQLDEIMGRREGGAEDVWLASSRADWLLFTSKRPDRVAQAYRQAAESLGAGPVRVLLRITLPLLLPALGAAAGLAVALSMGELGATVMVYPATWKTLPVTIFGLTDRGQAFQAAA